jgi:hypothetical protein
MPVIFRGALLGWLEGGRYRQASSQERRVHELSMHGWLLFGS